ncbi:ankyrin repeat-containing domain protein [Aspergillus pseudodeflectus]|uniref:Ankyrin repeat-containing domain protein n=1 Tax=Aspergillus pseudodeflectus TaxID=176178 RepID=A0ABR4L4B1_9EURO
MASKSEPWSTIVFLAGKGADLEDVVSTLITAGAKANATSKTTLFSWVSALSYAVTYRDWDQVPPLLEAGADCNSLALNGDPILVVAAAAQRWLTVRLLVECGGNVDATDRHGKTALSY